MSESNHIVLITGATGRLGNAMAQRFITAGADVILLGRNTDKLNKLSSKLSTIANGSQNIYSYSLDLKDLDEIPKTVQKIQEEVGNPDILINNAAIQGPIGQFIDNDIEEWNECLKVCLFAPISLCRAIIPKMIQKSYGRIINISGGGSTSERPGFSAYSTAKTGLVRFSETVSHETGPFGVNINCIAPGIMSSDMTQTIIKAGKETSGEKEYEAINRLIKDNSHNEEKAAELAYYLTTPEYNKLNGKIISAVWDPWEKIPIYQDILSRTDIYTLRRIVPTDRNLHGID